MENEMALEYLEKDEKTESHGNLRLIVV